jgi:hypothetical protein
MGGSSSTPTCAGEQVSGQCLYLGAVGASCQYTCATHGGVAPDAKAFLGTPAQGGTLEQCSAALKALGVTATVIQAARYDGRGLGCHLYDSVPYWLTSPAFSTTVGYVRTRIACACSE